MDKKNTYTLVLLTNNIKIIKNENSVPIYFTHYDKLYPTVNSFDKNEYKTVLLDSGAMAPISRGADVMIPGILKFKEENSGLSKDDVVGIEIENEGIFAVGKSLLNFKDLERVKSGVAIEILHFKGDTLENIK